MRIYSLAGGGSGARGTGHGLRPSDCRQTELLPDRRKRFKVDRGAQLRACLVPAPRSSLCHPPKASH